MKKPKVKKISGIKLITNWLQSTLDQALTIVVWVIVWSIVEQHIPNFSLATKLLIVLLLIIILQRDVKRK